MCLGLSISQSVKHGTVKGLNPSVGVHDGDVSTRGAFRDHLHSLDENLPEGAPGE